MKIEINLSDVYNEETGEVDGSIKDLIIDEVSRVISLRIEKSISNRIIETVDKVIKEKVNSFMETEIPNLMNYEFQPTSSYGATKEKTTVKNQILNALQSACTYEKKQYNSDCSTFTKAMLDIVSEQMKVYKPKFDKEINAIFVQEALDYAQAKLKERLGLK
jgi:hypothetical protein